MATDAYEAAIKGLKDLLRYDNILSASKGQSLHKSVGIHIHLQRSKLLFFFCFTLVHESSSFLDFCVILFRMN